MDTSKLQDDQLHALMEFKHWIAENSTKWFMLFQLTFNILIIAWVISGGAK